MSIQNDFSDIAPFDDEEFSEKMALLVKEPGFEHAVKFVMPDVNYPEFVKTLLSIHDKETFQTRIMWPFLEMLAEKTTAGISVGGLDNISPEKSYTFITNHRDIVLDASFLNLCFLRSGIKTSEVAIGNNLLIYEWITDLVKLNKSFIVKRNLRLTKALEAAKQLSAYIHYAITEKNESVWIAQREGRAKDSNDLTQESVIKMLGLAGGGSLTENIEQINIVPVSLSYEYDPNDYLKAREFLMRKNDPEFKKSQRDDLFSMETGLLQFKGHIHIEIGKCITPELIDMGTETDKPERVRRICRLLDCAIHSGYKIFPINYVAYDMLNGTDKYADRYTDADVVRFNEYVTKQLSKVELDGITENDYEYMRKMMLGMYSNPLRNKLSANDSTCNKS